MLFSVFTSGSFFPVLLRVAKQNSEEFIICKNLTVCKNYKVYKDDDTYESF